jgi:hypothetical protein
MKMIHGDVAHRVFNLGEPISYRIKSSVYGEGALYDVVNTASTAAGAGLLHIPLTGLTISVNTMDKDGIYHTSQMAQIRPNDILFIGTATAIVTSIPILTLDVVSFTVNALPVVVNGEYIVRVEKS